MTTPSIHWFEQACPTPDAQAQAKAEQHQRQLTKPPGSLGKLESLATRFAAFQSCAIPKLSRVTVRVFAADHGICAQNVSAFPQAVTGQMIMNFIAGGAAISVLAKRLDADFKVINLGTVNAVPDSDGLLNLPIMPGTGDFSLEPAMQVQHVLKALSHGRDQVNEADLFIGGEMGIGNTTSASAIYSVLLGIPPQQATGPGTGLDHHGQQHKAAIIARALKRAGINIESPASPMIVLSELGGLEIAALVGAYIGAAQRGIPVLIDGFICTAAALVASRLNPSSRAWMLFAHRSAEPAHSRALEHLNACPLLDLGMRLGEGSGAAVAVPIIEAALDLHAKMATFEHAGVSNQDA